MLVVNTAIEPKGYAPSCITCQDIRSFVYRIRSLDLFLYKMGCTLCIDYLVRFNYTTLKEIPTLTTLGSVTLHQKSIELKNQQTASASDSTRYCMPIRNQPKGRKIHSVEMNIQLGQESVVLYIRITYCV